MKKIILIMILILGVLGFSKKPISMTYEGKGYPCRVEAGKYSFTDNGIFIEKASCNVAKLHKKLFSFTDITMLHDSNHIEKAFINFDAIEFEEKRIDNNKKFLYFKFNF